MGYAGKGGVAKMSKQNGIKKLILQINVCDVVPRWAPSNDEGVVIVGCPMVRNFNWIVIPWKTFITEAYALRKMGCLPKNCCSACQH